MSRVQTRFARELGYTMKFFRALLCCSSLIAPCMAADNGASPRLPNEYPIQRTADVIGPALMHPGVTQFAVLTGSEAESIRATTHSTGGAIRVASTAIKMFNNQPGCGRVEVKILIPNVATTDGKIIPLWGQTFALNICMDGKPPKPASDVATTPIR